MRPKVVFTTLTIAVGLLVLTGLASKFLTRRPAAMATAPPAESTTSQPQITKPAAVTSPAGNSAPAATTEALDKLTALQNQRHDEYVRQRINELNDLAMNEDAASHAVILSELTNADQAIRHAALEALIQTKDQSVIPRLQQIAEFTEDPEEKAALLEAIKFINLPSLTDYLAEHGQDIASGVPPATRTHGWISSKPRENSQP